MAYMVVHTCQQIDDGLPPSVKMRMIMNIVLDFGVGLVPFLGDVADAVFRANTRNAAILEEYLRQKGRKNLRESGVPIPAVDPSLPEEFDRMHRDPSPATRPDGKVNHQPQQQGVMTAGPAVSHRAAGNGRTAARSAPAAQGAVSTTRKDKRRSLFGFVGRVPPVDLEMGHVSDSAPEAGPSAPAAAVVKNGRHAGSSSTPVRK